MSNITLADLTKAIKDLADSQDSLRDIVADIACHSNSNKGGKREVVNTPTTTAFNPAPFVTPTRDPNTMDVDATTTCRTTEEYCSFMAGKCYGCGSRAHCKADGHYEQDVCNHCRLTGHLANVCHSTSITPELSTSIIAAATSAPPPPTADFAQILQQLNANQQVLAAQITELCQNF
ncbi:hypothetical protein GYMLUDRAFT_241107 [Collybiopsis luxurians FD-317 M1]|nr:hypothetical protein GYMLUDRAFT_241107 [Collybiopsis luxurians FD-317 M1]